MNTEIKHAGHRFFVEVEGKTASLDYVLRDDKMDITHTYTPPELRGRGIAEQITTAAFEYARKNNFIVIPSCSYVRDAFLSRHPEFHGIVEKS